MTIGDLVISSTSARDSACAASVVGGLAVVVVVDVENIALFLYVVIFGSSDIEAAVVLI